ncbi:hypothetical protein RI578_17220 [Streptomyces sp. BB1-1-1]|uniref:hypothetical protein n=1 Tax=Streptomyces sp. BB1-1-1 TaxID=3074430 RepID=UPI002877BA99|nr:hypothetical protein [Streptomyces sp. BB1-1-1]WND40552.1 hypothetical protein RI578_17220 [Streptomyces sp. BB1-1-1]
MAGRSDQVLPLLGAQIEPAQQLVHLGPYLVVAAVDDEDAPRPVGVTGHRGRVGPPPAGVRQPGRTVRSGRSGGRGVHR